MRGVFLMMLLLLLACSATPVQENGTVAVLFCPRDHCMETMIELIHESNEIYCAFYDLDLEPLIAVLEAKQANVLLEEDNALDQFETGYSAALMHNKFCVLDGDTVITGSMNPTVRGNYYNNNNVVILNSPTLAKNYLDEWYELESGNYGGGSTTKATTVDLNGVVVENYFCPEDNCKLQVINELKQAQESIYFMVYSFTDQDIGNLLWNKQYLGLDVQGIYEDKQFRDYAYQELPEIGISDNNPYTFHHKVFIIDNTTVITGSFNPTANANERNDENIVIIHDATIAKMFVEEYQMTSQAPSTNPTKTASLIIDSVLYDAVGSDQGQEKVVVKNIGKAPLILDYYFLSNNKTNMQLYGVLQPGSTAAFTPSFSLRNSEGILQLKSHLDIIDYVFWEGIWEIEAFEGQYLVRINHSINSTAWQVN